MLLCKIGDFSDSVYVNFYRHQAESIMGGVTAEQLKAVKDSGDMDKLADIFIAA